MYLLEKKKTMETVIPKTMEEEVTDNHMSGLGIPQLGFIISLSTEHASTQNPIFKNQVL